MTSKSYRQTGTHRAKVANIGGQVRSGSGRLYVKCPKCNAKPGWRCESTRSKRYDDNGVEILRPPMKNFHPERKVGTRGKYQAAGDVDS